MTEWGWIAIAAGAVAVIGFVVFLALFRRPVTATRVTTTEPTGGSHADLILGDMTDVLSRGMPGESRDREEILPELVRAGLYGPSSLAEYRAVRAVLILLPLFTAAAIALLVQPRHIVYVALGGVILSALGYSLPRLYIAIKAAARTREIERGLPVFADMLSISLLAGQGLLGGLRRVTGQLRNAFPRMTEELEIVIRQADMLNLNVAFSQWANRSQMPEVRNLSIMLNQCQRLGNDVTSALMEYASNLRSGARQRADAKAQRASFWMLFPTILCLWIPAAVLIVAPVYFEFAARRAKAKEQMPKLDQNNPAINRFPGLFGPPDGGGKQ
jgi:tight adherence protein C